MTRYLIDRKTGKLALETINEAFACEELWNINNGLTLCLECHGNK